MLKAITHEPSRLLNQCELTFLDSAAIDIVKALVQHRVYCDLLRSLGAQVEVLTGNDDMPDSVFVEDTALTLDEIAVMTPMGVSSRQGETELIAAELGRYRKVERILAPAKLEGGDILRVGKRLFVGLGTRTDRAGIEALRAIVGVYGYQVVAVDVPGCLHLKTGCTALDERTILINPAWVDPGPFASFDRISVPDSEPFGANILNVGGIICMPAGFDLTRQRVESAGFQVAVVEISEFLKAEAGLTCMSLIFDVATTEEKA